MKKNNSIKSWLILGSTVLLSILLGASFGGTRGTADAMKQVYPSVKKDKIGEQRLRQVTPYLDPANQQVKWDLILLEELVVGDYLSKEGTEVSELIASQGKAGGVAYDYNDLTLTWKQGGTSDPAIPQIKAVFENSAGLHYLRRASGDTMALEEAREWDLDSKLKENDFDQFRLGDGQTGVGGVDIREVLPRFGKAYFSLGKSSKTDRTSLELRYTGENSQNYRLFFFKQEDGRFLLGYKMKM